VPGTTERWPLLVLEGRGRFNAARFTRYQTLTVWREDIMRATWKYAPLLTSIVLSVLVLCLGGLAGTAVADDSLPISCKDSSSCEFDMVVSAGAAGCLPDASGHVTINSQGPVEVMDVNVEGLPPNTEFDFFVIQVPKAPFGLSWYQGDIETNAAGRGHERFIGRFSIETFIVAPGVAPAPVVHNDGPFPDASANPATAPVHTFHLGLWFNSPADAEAAGCSSATTPFNGDHTAGIQVLNTSNFPDDQGPLRQVTP
jgi:hypothetical protein